MRIRGGRLGTRGGSLTALITDHLKVGGKSPEKAQIEIDFSDTPPRDQVGRLTRLSAVVNIQHGDPQAAVYPPNEGFKAREVIKVYGVV